MTRSLFPLFKLLNNAQRFVLKCMDFKQLIAFSILSNRAKTAIKELNLKIDTLDIDYHDLLTIVVVHDNRFYSFEFVPEIKDNWERETASTKGYLKAAYFGILRKEGYTMVNWTDHFRFVSNQDHMDGVHFYHSLNHSLDFQSLRKCLRNTRMVVFSKQFPHEIYYNVVKACRPVDQILFEFSVGRMDGSHALFLQNLTVLRFTGFIDPIQILKLDDLLVMNCKSISVKVSILTGNDINRFLKLFIKGGNPRLQYTNFQFPRNHGPTANQILKGVQHKVADEDREQTSTYTNIDEENKACKVVATVKGGIDLRRRNGQRATIVFEENDGHVSKIIMYVWDL